MARLVEESQAIMRMYAWNTALQALAAKYIVPRLPDSLFVAWSTALVPDAVGLRVGSFETAPHTVPFTDELQKKKEEEETAQGGRSGGLGATAATVSAVLPLVALASVLLSKTGRGHADHVVSTLCSWLARV